MFTRYQTEGQDIMCHVNETAEDLTLIYTCSEEEKSSSITDFKYVFYFGHLLLGIGSSPLYTLGMKNFPIHFVSEFHNTL